MSEWEKEIYYNKSNGFMITRLRNVFKNILKPLVIIAYKIGVSGNQLTILGFIFSLFYIFTISIFNNVIFALLFLLISGLMDALDGEVARMRGEVSKLGSFLDSTIDRIEDIIYIMGLGFLGTSWLIISLLIGISLLISYLRAKGESLGLKIEGKGLIERGERIILLSFILLIYIFNITIFYILLIILLILSIITFIQRYIYILSHLKSI
jgi:archaetidylinositol phosphate synthase